MDDWKYDLLVKLKRGDPDAFVGLDLNYNMQQCYRRMADNQFEIIEGRLHQAKKSKKKVTTWLKEPADIPDNPKLGTDFQVEIVHQIKWLPVTRRSDTTDLFFDAHDERGHPGRDTTLAFIKTHNHWHGMKRDVENYVRSCGVCQRTRVDETKPPLEHIIEAEPFARWQIDLTQIPGVPGYFLIVIDCFTKFVWFKFLPSKHAVGVLSFLLSLIKKEGKKPRKIHSDNEGEFIAEIIKQVCTTFEIDLLHGRPYHPQSQGQVERVNRTLKGMLYKLLEARYGGKEGVSAEDLESAFDEVVDLYNNNKHSSTGFSPMQLQRPIIKTPTKDLSLVELQQVQRLEMVSLFAIAHDNLIKAAAKQDKVHNAKHHSKLRVFKVGDKVLYRWPEELRQNGDFLYNSVARITAEHKNGRYGLEWLENEPSNAKNRKTWSAGELKKFREREPGPNNNVIQDPPAPAQAINNTSIANENEEGPEVGEKQMEDVEVEVTDTTVTDISNNNNKTNARASEELCSLYESLVTTDDLPTEEQWLGITAPVNLNSEPVLSNEMFMDDIEPPKQQQSSEPVYQPRKRQRIQQKSTGSQSRLWKEIGLNN